MHSKEELIVPEVEAFLKSCADKKEEAIKKLMDQFTVEEIDREMFLDVMVILFYSPITNSYS
jgi:hypothetical protein